MSLLSDTAWLHVVSQFVQVPAHQSQIAANVAAQFGNIRDLQDRVPNLALYTAMHGSMVLHRSVLECSFALSLLLVFLINIRLEALMLNLTIALDYRSITVVQHRVSYIDHFQ